MEKLYLETTKFRVPLLSVCVDDGENKKIAFSPYIAEFPVKKGKHLIKLTAYGNRINTFGTLHNCNEKEFLVRTKCLENDRSILGLRISTETGGNFKSTCPVCDV